MGGAVVDDQVQRFVLGRFAVDLAQELQPFGVGVALLAWVDDSAVAHVGCSLGAPRDRAAAHPARLQVVRLLVPPHGAGAESQHRNQLARAPRHGRLGRALRRRPQPLRNVHLHRRRSVRPTPFHALRPRRQAAFVPVRNPHARCQAARRCRCIAGPVPLTARSARAVPARCRALAACQLRRLDRGSNWRLLAPVQTEAKRWSGATNLRPFASQTPRCAARGARGCHAGGPASAGQPFTRAETAPKWNRVLQGK